MQLGRGREKVVGEGREGAKSQEIEIAVVGDDYSAHVRSNRPRAAPFPAVCPLSSFQRTHSSLPTYPTVCLKSQNVRCRFFLRLQCSALFKPISLFHSARRARARDGGDQRHHFKEARHGARPLSLFLSLSLSLSLCRSVESSLIDCMKPSFPGVSGWSGTMYSALGERGEGWVSITGRETPLAALFVLYVHIVPQSALLPLPPHCKGPSLLPPGSPCQNPVFRVGSLAPHVTNQRHRTTMTVTGERQNPCLARELEDDDVAPLRRGGREEEDAPSIARQPAKISCRPSLQGRLFGGCRSLARSPADTRAHPLLQKRRCIDRAKAIPAPALPSL